MHTQREPSAEKAAPVQEPSLVNIRESILCKSTATEKTRLLPKSSAGEGLFCRRSVLEEATESQDRWASVQTESKHPSVPRNLLIAMAACVLESVIFKWGRGCGKVVASWGCELPKGLLTLDTYVRQRTTGYAHIHVPLQNSSKKKKILRSEPERASLSSVSVPSAPSTDKAQPHAQCKEKCINTSSSTHYLRADTGG